MELRLADLQGAHTGQTATIIGKGPTEYVYREGLPSIDGPVVFLNDAVTLEKYCGMNPKYFFFLENHVGRAHLPRPMRSVSAVPGARGRFDINSANTYFCHAPSPEQLDADQMVAKNKLYCSNGTICTAIAFLWIAGVKHVRLIGCDGINERDRVRQLNDGADYPSEIANVSGSRPGWIYARIRACQEDTLKRAGISWEYVGTPRLDGRPRVRFVSYATPSYEGKMTCLADSISRLGVASHLEIIADKGGWTANTAFKPQFLRMMQKEYPSDRLVWVDADAVLNTYPELLFNMPDDLDVATGCRARMGNEVLSGTVYLGTTAGARQLVEDWCAEQEKSPTVWDQKTLARVIRKYRHQFLPPEYCFICDTFRVEHPGVEPIIEHYQASRELRK